MKPDDNPHSVKNFNSLEGLRGYMAWWVVIGHAIQLCGAREYLPKILGSLLLHGSAAVNTFIIVSGFVITHLLLSKAEPYGIYIARRTLRIFPIYVVCLVIALISVSAYEFSFTVGSWVDQRDLRIERLAETEQGFWTYLALHLVMLHGIVPENILAFSSSTILTPAWSLSLEWQFYLLAPALILFMKSSRIALIAVAAVSLGLVALFQSGFMGVWRYPSVLPISMHFFLIGILSRLFFTKIAAMPLALPLLIGVGGALLLRPLAAELLIWGFFLTAAVLEHRGKLGFLPRAFSLIAANGIVTRLGRSSYSTYLFHIPLFAIVVWAGSAISGVHSQQSTMVSTLIAMALLVPTSFALYQYVERPFILLGKSLRNRPVKAAA